MYGGATYNQSKSSAVAAQCNVTCGCIGESGRFKIHSASNTYTQWWYVSKAGRITAIRLKPHSNQYKLNMHMIWNDFGVSCTMQTCIISASYMYIISI